MASSSVGEEDAVTSVGGGFLFLSAEERLKVCQLCRLASTANMNIQVWRWSWPAEFC